MLTFISIKVALKIFFLMQSKYFKQQIYNLSQNLYRHVLIIISNISTRVRGTIYSGHGKVMSSMLGRGKPSI